MMFRFIFSRIFKTGNADRTSVVVSSERFEIALHARRKLHNAERPGTREVSIDGPFIKGRCYVVDGDTIRIGNTRIRLLGIDAPEIDHPYGKKAKWAMQALCKGQIISAQINGTDVHGRSLAICYLPDGRDLSAELVKLGLALDWPYFSKGKYAHLEPENIRRTLWRQHQLQVMLAQKSRTRTPAKTSF